MKKIYALMMMLLAVSVSAEAASKWKLYVNPGHGGYTSNDRQTTMPAVNGVKFTETQGCFWESEGNTYRAWGIEYFWKKRVGSNIKLSRYENTQSGDLTLSTIAANSNSYGGYFMSLHTNAGNASANYMIIMCRSVSSSNYSAYSSTSLNMAKDAAYWQGGESTASMSTKGYGGGKSNHVTSKTYSTDRGTTDRTFYNGSSLGVLRTNNAPGYLAESWFHDYRPEAFRLMSVGYNYFLAWQLMRAYLDSPGLSGVSLYPIIFGDIRDTSKSCGYTSYTTRGRDKYLAVNGAKVTLVNKATGGTKTYTTDHFNNGFFTFYDCVPGATYTITVEKDGKSISKDVTVDNSTIGTQHKVLFDMSEATATSITIDKTDVDLGTVQIADDGTIGTTEASVTVTGKGLSSTISVTSSSSLFTVSTSSLPASGGSLTIKYAPTARGKHSGTITLKSGTITKEIPVSGICKNKTITFDQGWCANETDLGWTNKITPTEWDYTEIRSICYGAGKLYLSSPDTEKKIHIINARTGEYIKSLNMDGVTGGAKEFCDIKYVGGKIVATSIATTPDDATKDQLKVYVWDNDEATPKCILNTTMPDGYDRIGDTFYVKGDLTNGGIYYAGHKSVGANNILCYSIENGTVNTTPAETVIGDGAVDLGTAPRVIAETSGKFWVNGKGINPTLLDTDGAILATVKKEAMIYQAYYNDVDVTNTYGNAFKAFTFKGVTYGMATTFLTKGQTNNDVTTTDNYQMGRAVLFDATDGWADATYLADYPWKGMGLDNSKIKNTMSTAIEVAVNGDLGVEAWILIHGQGLVYVKCGTVPSSVIAEAKTPVLTVDETSVSFETTAGGEPVSKTINVSGTDLAGNIELGLSNNNAGAFSLSTNNLETGGEVTITFAPAEAGNYNATLNITSEGAESKTVEISGYAEANLNEVGALTEGWNYSATASSIPGWIVNNSTDGYIRSIAFANNKLYILQNKGWGTPVVDIVDAYNGESKSELNMTGVSGGIVSLSSLVAVDGAILGSNAARNSTTGADGVADVLKVYKWISDTEAPTVILEDATHADEITGAKISFSGDLTNGRIWFTNHEENKVLYYEITNGTVAQTPVVINLVSGSSAFHTGEASAWGSGSVYYNEDGTFWVDFKDDLPTLFSAPVTVDGVNTSSEVSYVQSGLVGGNRFGTDFKLFGYKEKQYAVAMTFLGVDDRVYQESTDENESASDQVVISGADNRLYHGAFVLIDVTDGVDAATSNMGTYPTAGLGSSKNDHYATTLCVNPRTNGVDIWVCSYTQGVAYFYYGEQISTGVESIDAEINAPVEYYNLQGVRVMNPENGLYIKRQGNKVTKVIL